MEANLERDGSESGAGVMRIWSGMEANMEPDEICYGAMDLLC